MKFDMPTLFIDPSYTLSGLCLVDPKEKAFEFQGFSRAETKRDLHHYYIAARESSSMFASYLERVLARYSSLTVVMEAPFPGSFASSGLYMLQAYYLKVLEAHKERVTFYSLSPSFISGQVKKACNKQDGIGVRKRWCVERLSELQAKGWSVKNSKMLKIAGADCQTAFGFWYFLSQSDKQLELFDL